MPRSRGRLTNYTFFTREEEFMIADEYIGRCEAIIDVLRTRGRDTSVYVHLLYKWNRCRDALVRRPIMDSTVPVVSQFRNRREEKRAASQLDREFVRTTERMLHEIGHHNPGGPIGMMYAPSYGARPGPIQIDGQYATPYYSPYMRDPRHRDTPDHLSAHQASDISDGHSTHLSENEQDLPFNNHRRDMSDHLSAHQASDTSEGHPANLSRNDQADHPNGYSSDRRGD